MFNNIISQHFPNLKSSLSTALNQSWHTIRRQEWLYFWYLRNLIIWLPLALGIVMSVALAQTIVTSAFHLSLIIIFLVPTIILYLTYPFIAILVWLLAAPFVQVTPDAAYRALFWVIHRAMIPGALITVFLANQLRIKLDTQIKLNKIDFAILFSLFFLIVSVILNFSSPLAMIYNVYDRFFIGFAAYWLIRFVNPNEENLKYLFPIAFIMVTTEGVIGLLSWFAPDILPPEWLSLQGYRTTGTFKSYSGYTVGAMTYGLLVFYAAVNSKSTTSRWLYFVAFGLSALSIFISFSRGSWLAALVVALVLFVLYPTVMARMTAIMLVVMSILAATLLAQQFTFAGERLEDDETARTRLVIYAAGWELVKSKPFFGWGYGTYDLYDRQFYGRVANFSVGQKDFSSHNTFLTVLAERGTVGFFFYYFPVFWLAYLTLKIWPRMPDDGLSSRKFLMIFWLMLIFQIIMGNFTDNDADNFIFGIWWMAIAFIANLVEKYLEPGDTGLPAWVYRALK